MVLTQKILCKIIPSKNKTSKINKYLQFGKTNELITYAPIIVKITSTIAISKIRNECGPSPTLPKISLY